MKINLSVKKEDFDFMQSKILAHKTTLHQLGINEGIKKSLIEDIHIISNILNKKPKE